MPMLTDVVLVKLDARAQYLACSDDEVETKVALGQLVAAIDNLQDRVVETMADAPSTTNKPAVSMDKVYELYGEELGELLRKGAQYLHAGD